MNKLITNNCEECGSDLFIVSNGYHACTGCGFVSDDLVLEEQIFYSHENRTNSYFKNTTIGNRLEIIRHQYTSRMNSMIKLDYDKNKHQLLIQTVRKVIKILLFILRLPERDKIAIFTIFKDFRPNIQKRTKFWNPEKLIPCIIYVYYKYYESRLISSVELINYSKISQKENNYFMTHNSYLWVYIFPIYPLPL
ncbi:hypothetical protein ES703_47206 [subsurface metagenome]